MSTNKRSFRPTSLREVAANASAGESFDLSLANFLDEFYATPRGSALEEEPQLLAPQFGWDGQVQDPYLAATAEELARKYKVSVPAWVSDESRKLHRPWFASTLAGLRAVLILESPPAFRSRNLFVSENALSRA
jgi:hypothetical protein